jgi:hypothetical protein
VTGLTSELMMIRDFPDFFGNDDGLGCLKLLTTLFKKLFNMDD